MTEILLGNSPAFYPCLLLLWPWVCHLNFRGSGPHLVYEGQCYAKPSQQWTRPSPHSKMEILALSYLTRILWGLMLIQHFEDLKCYVSPKYYPTWLLKLLLGICRTSLKAWNVWLPFQFASDRRKMQNIYSCWLTGWAQLHLSSEEGLAEKSELSNFSFANGF